MTTQTTPKAQSALDLYERVIRPCFTTQAARAEAIGLSRQALRSWDQAELRRVNEESLRRLQLVADACERLDATHAFGNRSAIGSYLLGSCMLDHPVRRLDLLLNSGDGEIVVELANAERQALAHVAIARLPREALDAEAWEPILESLSPRARAEHERLAEQGVDVPAAL